MLLYFAHKTLDIPVLWQLKDKILANIKHEAYFIVLVSEKEVAYAPVIWLLNGLL